MLQDPLISGGDNNNVSKNTISLKKVVYGIVSLLVIISLVGVATYIGLEYKSKSPSVVSNSDVVLSSNTDVKDNVVEICILSLSNANELKSTQGLGGMGRLMTLKQSLLSSGFKDGLITVSSGGIYGFTPFNHVMRYEDGRHIVDTYNYLGVDLATFGDRDYIYAQPQFESRLQQSNFTYIATNIKNRIDETKPFYDTVSSHIITRRGVRVLFMSVSAKCYLQVNYATVLDIPASSAAIHEELNRYKANKVSWDLLVILASVSDEDIKQLVEITPEIDLVLGGQSHFGSLQNYGVDRSVFVSTTDHQSRSVYTHTIRIDRSKIKSTPNQQLTDYVGKSTYQQYPLAFDFNPRYIPLTANIPDHSGIMTIVNHYWIIAVRWFDENFLLDIDQIFMDLKDSILDITYSKLRFDPEYHFTSFFSDCVFEDLVDAREDTVDIPSFGLFHVGAIYADNKYTGTLTEYDFELIHPFGSTYIIARASGKNIYNAIRYAMGVVGEREFLAKTSNLHCDWTLKEKSINIGFTECWFFDPETFKKTMIQDTDTSSYIFATFFDVAMNLVPYFPPDENGKKTMDLIQVDFSRDDATINSRLAFKTCLEKKYPYKK